MTKPRPPLSIDAALARIAGLLDGGYDKAGEIVGRSPRTVRNWGDPDAAEQIPVDCAIALDLAYIEAGGDGAPIHEAYTFKLELAEIERFAERHQLGRLAAAYIRESGQAGSALVEASLPGASSKQLEAAEREVAEAFEVLKRTIQVLQQATGPPATAAD